MSPLFTFIVGLLVGWLIEWIIDYMYWRRRTTKVEIEPASLKAVAPNGPPAAEVKSAPVIQAVPDNLKRIKGIGVVIERKLNEAGIVTFEQLGNLTPAELRTILGNTIQRLANEESLLQQARDFARGK